MHFISRLSPYLFTCAMRSYNVETCISAPHTQFTPSRAHWTFSTMLPTQLWRQVFLQMWLLFPSKFPAAQIVKIWLDNVYSCTRGEKNAPRAWTKCENTECNIWRPGCHLGGIATLTWRPALYLSTGCGVLLALRLLEHEARKLRFFFPSRVYLYTLRKVFIIAIRLGGLGGLSKLFACEITKLFIRTHTQPEDK